jgi:hypothetical protein
MSVVVTLHATMRCSAYLIRYLPPTFKLSKTSISEGFQDYTPETMHHVLRQVTSKVSHRVIFFVEEGAQSMRQWHSSQSAFCLCTLSLWLCAWCQLRVSFRGIFSARH